MSITIYIRHMVFRPHFTIRRYKVRHETRWWDSSPYPKPTLPSKLVAEFQNHGMAFRRQTVFPSKDNTWYILYKFEPRAPQAYVWAGAAVECPNGSCSCCLYVREKSLLARPCRGLGAKKKKKLAFLKNTSRKLHFKRSPSHPHGSAALWIVACNSSSTTMGSNISGKFAAKCQSERQIS
jgi:hypothetical protein